MNSDELPKSINIKDAINLGFLDEYLNDNSEPVVVDVIGEIQDLVERLPLDQPMDAEEYMVIDDNVTAREIPTDEELFQS
ncbi:10496_t:CDS:2 [Paraglomus occultum]|uniref:10496_t:CDS:1 n=1 Tax=Paraglomus occultum TaxID=144539 RepID=A0A9N9FHI1_9GLOM|nr:10496_t:CDS:2 [Paraglomus occultum]